MVSYFIAIDSIDEDTIVLILIVVEDGLVLPKRSADKETGECLNPYCSGRWSRTSEEFDFLDRANAVLILIVVEDGLVHIINNLII